MTELFSKKDCRVQQKACLKELADHHPADKVVQEAKLYRKLFSSAGWRSADVVAVTKSLPYELNTAVIIEQAWRENKTVAVAEWLKRGSWTLSKLVQKRLGRNLIEWVWLNH